MPNQGAFVPLAAAYLARYSRVVTREPDLLDLLRVWDGLRGSRRWPARGDIDPEAFRLHLGELMLIAVEHDPLRFRYRLIGDLITEAAGYDMTHETFEDQPDPVFRDFCLRLFTNALAHGEPVSAAGERTIDGQVFGFDSLLLPLSGDGQSIDQYMAKLVYPRSRNEGRRPEPRVWRSKRERGTAG
ncbi:PAS domain-containing protein [Arenibaculum pallidiluteum]|uniref:PAS domain-containing protein n=1 Tax=Arenibaculum pallidiluteum TaxID=2812559 RepID=UPI001A95BEEF|nr:PAS domain-containing protein [Arenibaculum pallidiluteum]